MAVTVVDPRFIPGFVGEEDVPAIDRKDPRYIATKKKMMQYLAMGQMWAMLSKDGDDDEVVAMATEFLTSNFDRIWFLRHPKK